MRKKNKTRKYILVPLPHMTSKLCFSAYTGNTKQTRCLRLTCFIAASFYKQLIVCAESCHKKTGREKNNLQSRCKSFHSLFYLVCFYLSNVAISVDMTAQTKVSPHNGTFYVLTHPGPDSFTLQSFSMTKKLCLRQGTVYLAQKKESSHCFYFSEQ